MAEWRLPFLYGLFLLFSNLVYSDQQTIELFEYRQEDSHTNCTDGLLADLDTIVFKGRVEYSQDPTMEHVFISMKRKTDTLYFLEKQYNIQNDCHDAKSNDCRHIDEHTVEIYLNIKASKDISGARLRGKLITSSQQDIFTDDQIIPDVYDSEDHNVVLEINGVQQTVDNGDCNYNDSDSDLIIFFMLESKLSPFYIEMSSKDPYMHVQGNNHVAYHLKTNVSLRFNVTIAYYPCRKEGHVNTIRCNIQIAHEEKMSFVRNETCSDNSKSFYTIETYITILIATLAMLATLAIVLIICVLVYLRRILHKIRSKPDFSDHGTGPLLTQDQSSQTKAESVGLTTICENDASCHTVKEHMHKCKMEIVYNDYENKNDKKIEDEPVEKQENEPLMQPDHKTKGSPLPKGDHCENKEEEAKETHNSYIPMNRYLTLTTPGNCERDNGRITRQGNNVDELLDKLGVKKKSSIVTEDIIQ